MTTKSYNKRTTLKAMFLLHVSAVLQAAENASIETKTWLTLNNFLLIFMLVLVVILVIIVRKNATRLLALRNELNQMSRTDHLTQLYRREYFEKRLYEVFERHIRNKRSSSVLMMVEINDMDSILNSGQTASELVIQRVVKIILERVRNTDLSGRFANNTFIILLRDTTIEPAETLAKELREKIASAKIKYGEQTISTTCSFGLAAYDSSMDSCIDWIRSADQALNQAKHIAGL
ncbi:GGDEF domain-containing protein [Marinicella sp. S1101]|uniref:GGDEF domain-containing protein n=1 Tax=Marinicella marina TaxID=2996016 RepID=UPI002260AE90|nr:GGDEF domain-containing protein [Marinicella marina]MCX7553198.1 GGDEF domain-containing protein [Marinicella marina]MDJ1138930.1 GGDEF domain-containing protein [Marinicella marina]